LASLFIRLNGTHNNILTGHGEKNSDLRLVIKTSYHAQV
jgi:hypothetical protein